MAYEDDRDMDLDRQLYEEDPAYEADTYFGERLDTPASDETDSDMSVEEYEEEDTVEAEPTFGESLNPDETEQADETSAHDESEDPSVLDQAKDKLDDWTDRDQQ
jgi:hypothetical protein